METGEEPMRVKIFRTVSSVRLVTRFPLLIANSVIIVLAVLFG